MAAKPIWRVGIDTGGTFTDVVAAREREVRHAKVASTPPRLRRRRRSRGSRPSGSTPADVLLLAHGTTVTTNAVITKTRRAYRARDDAWASATCSSCAATTARELYDILWDPPEPLVPRRRRLEVTERVDYAGAVVARARRGGASRRRSSGCATRGIESLAVCFLHSYANPAHERRVQEIVARAVAGAVRLDLVGPPARAAGVRADVDDRRRTRTSARSWRATSSGSSGASARADSPGRLLIMHSGGGLLPAASVDRGAGAHGHLRARRRGRWRRRGSARSGAPAAGAMAAEAIAAATGADQLISLDMGGTSADIAVVRDGRALLVNEYSPEFGLPIRFPAVDLLTIGAGGGSIAWIDAAGAPQVGPQSAGARPGPACYGARRHRADRHRREPRARPALGGDAARRAPRAATSSRRRARRRRASPSAIGLAAGRGGARDRRDHEQQHGKRDPGDDRRARASIRASSRCSPSAARARCTPASWPSELGIRAVLVPLAPGVTSALGTLFVDVVHDVARSHIAPLGRARPRDAVEAIFRELELEARRGARDRPWSRASASALERSIDLRYVGQLKTLPIAVAGEPFDAERSRGARASISCASTSAGTTT